MAHRHVDVVQWPGEHERLERVRSSATPVLLLVEPGGVPPAPLGELEDWARTDTDALEIHARITALAARADALDAAPGEVDEAGILRVGAHWQPLAPIDARIMAELLAHAGEAVSHAQLKRVGWDDATLSNDVLRVHMVRLRRRIAEAGLRIRTVRGRGYVLEPRVTTP